MKNVWDDFVAIAIQNEILVQSGQADADAPCVPAPSKRRPWLRGLINLLTDDLDDDFPDLDTPSNRLATEDTQHYCGTVQGPFGAVCKHFEITADGACHRICLDNETLCQKYFFKENERLHIYADQTDSGLVARLVMDEDAFSAARYFCGPDFDVSVAEDFLHLDSRRQTAYIRLATHKALRKSALCGLSYIATHALADEPLSALDSWTEQFSARVAGKISCADLKRDLLQMYARDLLGPDLTAPDPGDLADPLFYSRNKLLPLALFAVIGGFSVWHEQGLSTGQILGKRLSAGWHILLRDALCTMAASKLVEPVLQALMDAFPDYPKLEETFNDIFFAVCKHSTCISDSILHRMCDLMFRDGIYRSQTQQMCDVLSGPNSEHFCSYIMDRFTNACVTGIAQYHFCAAAIVNAQRHRAGQNPLEEAVREITRAATDRDYLLNVLCLGMLAWDDRIARKHYPVKGLVLEQKTVDKLVSHLSTPDRLRFPIVACAIHDLILKDILEPTILGEKVRQTALRALGDDQIRKRAEELLSLIPLPATPPAKGNQKLLQNYLERYEACHRNSKSDEQCEQLFAVLCHLGTFPTAQERREQFDRIMERFTERAAYADSDTKWRMGNLMYSVGLAPYVWTDFPTRADPATLDHPLSEERKAELLRLSKRLGEEDGTYRVTNTEESLEIIKFIAPYTYSARTRQAPEPVGLGAHVLLEVSDPGSYIIVKWFEILCRYATGPRVLAYYRAYHQVLDLPDSLFPDTSRGSNRQLYEAHKAFLQKSPRVLEGLRLAVMHSNPGVIAAFMDSEYRPLTDNPQFVDSVMVHAQLHGCLAELCTIYEGRYGTEEALARRKQPEMFYQALEPELRQIFERIMQEPATPQSASAPPEGAAPIGTLQADMEYLPTRYYDDPTIRAYTLLKTPQFSHLVTFPGRNDR